MKKRIILVFLLILTVLSAPAFAGPGTANGSVKKVYVYGDGRILVTGFTFDGASSNNNGGFYISGSHPCRNTLLSLILAAKATSKQLSVTANINDGWYPKIESSPICYIIMNE